MANNPKNSTTPVTALRALIASHQNLDSATSSRIGSIIRIKRPSIPVSEGHIDRDALLAAHSLAPHSSSSADACIDIAKTYSASVARIEVRINNTRYQPIGTCFLVRVRDSVRMATAGHMLLELLGPGNSVRRSRPLETRHPMRQARVNFHDTGAEDPTQIFDIKEQWVWAHPRWDLLLFDLDVTPADIANRIALPLEQNEQWWHKPEANHICVLGYPMNSNNGRNNPFTATFNGPLGIKRLSPGLCDQPPGKDPPAKEVEDVSTIKRDRSTIDHDASTLQGSSGSPVFSLISKKVIGLHYDGGEFHRSRHRPPPDPNNAVNIPVALLEHELCTNMSDSLKVANGQSIDWDPDVPGWSGRGTLELNTQRNHNFIPVSNSPVLQNVVPDRPDFRDRIYRSSLLRANDELRPSNKGARFIRNQGEVPACTAFAVAAAINVQLHELGRANQPVSEQMLYSMATLHDEWIDDSKGGSSVRGAIKGFYQNGVCLASAAPLTADGLNWSLSRVAALQARSITLGAYYRLLPNLLDFQLALNETGAIVVSAHIHSGWTSTECHKSGRISPRGKNIGTHAFVILGYVQDGFIIQNSWGEQWSSWNGHPGLAHWHYDDWAENLIDAWVLRLAPSTPRAFDLVPKIASQHLLLQSENAEDIQLPSLPRPRRFSLIGHVCQVERDRFINDGKLGMGIDSLRETSLYLCSRAAKRKYPKIAFFFHDPLLGHENIGKLCSWMIKPFKRHGVYPIHIVYGIDEAHTIKLRIEHECQIIKDRFGAAEKDLSFYIERRVSQLMQPLIKVFRAGIEDAAMPGNPFWQVLASVCLENGEDREFNVFASGIGYCLVEQLAGLSESSSAESERQHASDNIPLFKQPLANLFLLAPSATFETIKELQIEPESTNELQITRNLSVCTLAEESAMSNQLRGYRGDWIDLTARVTGLDDIGTTAIRNNQNTRDYHSNKKIIDNRSYILEASASNTLHAASADAEVLNKCLDMFSGESCKANYGFE